MTEVSIAPVFTSAGMAAVANATGNGLQVTISHVAIGDAGYTIKDGNGDPLQSALDLVALSNELERVTLSAGGSVSPNQVLLQGSVPVADTGAGDPVFFVREVGFFLDDGTLLAVWSDATMPMGYRGELAAWLFRIILAWQSLPENSITVTFDGDAALAAAILDAAQNEAKIRYVIEQASLVYDDQDNAQLYQALMDIASTGAKTVKISNATFEGAIVDGEAVRWDVGNSRFEKAIADGTANNQAIGIADVTNAEIICIGETRAGLVGGLTPGSKVFLDSVTAGELTHTVQPDRVIMGIAKAADIMYVDVDSQSDALHKNVSNTVSVGFPSTPYPLGNINADLTPNVSVGHYQYGTVTGAFALNLPAFAGAGWVSLELNSGAGSLAVDVSAYTNVIGAFDANPAIKNVFFIEKLQDGITLNISQVT